MLHYTLVWSSLCMNSLPVFFYISLGTFLYLSVWICNVWYVYLSVFPCFYSMRKRLVNPYFRPATLVQDILQQGSPPFDFVGYSGYITPCSRQTWHWKSFSSPFFQDFILSKWDLFPFHSSTKIPNRCQNVLAHFSSNQPYPKKKLCTVHLQKENLQEIGAPSRKPWSPHRGFSLLSPGLAAFDPRPTCAGQRLTTDGDHGV